MDKPILKPKIAQEPGSSELLTRIAKQVAALAARKQIFGGNVYIQPEPPSNPQVNDIWYNTNSLITERS